MARRVRGDLVPAERTPPVQHERAAGHAIEVAIVGEDHDLDHVIEEEARLVPGFIPAERKPPPPGISEITIQELAAALFAIGEAEERGNLAPLTDRLRTAAVLLQEERELAADLLEGKIKRPAHRPPNDAGSEGLHDVKLALNVAMHMAAGKSTKAAVDLASIEMGCGRATVYAVWSPYVLAELVAMHKAAGKSTEAAVDLTSVKMRCSREKVYAAWRRFSHCYVENPSK